MWKPGSKLQGDHLRQECQCCNGYRLIYEFDTYTYAEHGAYSMSTPKRAYTSGMMRFRLKTLRKMKGDIIEEIDAPVAKKPMKHKIHTWSLRRNTEGQVVENCTECRAIQVLGNDTYKYCYYPNAERIYTKIIMSADDKRYRALVLGLEIAQDAHPPVFGKRHVHTWVHAKAIERSTSAFTDHCACSATRTVSETTTSIKSANKSSYTTVTKPRLKQVWEMMNWTIK